MIQQAHLCLYHYLCQAIERELLAQPQNSCRSTR
jgi:hypothetical protein